MLFTQARDASEEYQRLLEKNQMRVERITSLLMSIVEKCEGLDEDDEEFAPFGLDLHEIEPKNVWVDEEDHGKIVSALYPFNYATI